MPTLLEFTDQKRIQARGLGSASSAVFPVIRKVRDQGISIILIKHVIKAIKSVSDRLLVLHHGEKIAAANRSEY